MFFQTKIPGKRKKKSVKISQEEVIILKLDTSAANLTHRGMFSISALHRPHTVLKATLHKGA